MNALPQLSAEFSAVGTCLQLVPAGGGGVNDYAASLQTNGLTGAIVSLAAPMPVNWEIYDTVLLQYSGYGYARRGAPLWLLHWLQKERPRIRKLGVFFHELYATGPVWRSEFWMSPVQRHVVKGLAELSDFWLTNRQASAYWVNARSEPSPQVHLATPSGVGELASAIQERKKRVIVFGGAGLRSETYRKAGEALWNWTKSAGLEVHDIGPPVLEPEIQRLLKTRGVQIHGRMPASEVSAQLAQAYFGLLAYPFAFAAKSSVLGAYCAHALCPVVLTDVAVPSDGLEPGKNCLVGIPSDPQEYTTPMDIAHHAHLWYQPHSVGNHVRAILQLSMNQRRT